MTELAILIVEDEPEVRDALIRDSEPFEGQFRIEAAEDVDDAHAAVQSLDDAGQEHVARGKHEVEQHEHDRHVGAEVPDPAEEHGRRAGRLPELRAGRAPRAADLRAVWRGAA